MAYRSQTARQLGRGSLVNVYLVWEDDGLTLIDAALPWSHKAILAAAQAWGAPIRRIALTHAHPDHVGAVDKLAAALPGVEFLVPRRDALFLNSPDTPQPGDPSKVRKPVNAKVRTPPTGLLDEGDHVGSLEVVDAPGHSPGHVAFLDPRDGTLFCGDVFTTFRRVATTAGRVLPPSTFTWHKPTELESARKLRALDPARLAPGHGPVAEAPAAAIDQAIARVS